MAHVTSEGEAAINEVMQMLEAQPLDTTSAIAVLPFTNDDQIPSQREKLAVLVLTGKSKEAIDGSSHMTRLNAFQTRMFKNTPKGMKPTSATRPLIL